MTIEEFFDGCKTADSELSGKIEEIRKQYELEKLYLIRITSEKIVWGARGHDVDWQKLILDLVVFVLASTGVDYNTQTTSVNLIQDGVFEVDLLIDSLIRDYVESHEGKIELVSLDENSGEVVISMSGTCGSCASLPATLKGGVEKILKEHLPWVKNVRLPGDEPDQPVSVPAQAPSKNSDDVFLITEKAAGKIRSLVDEAKFGNSAGLRIRLSPGGCSGFQYALGVEERPMAEDEVFVRQFEEGGNQSAGRVFIDLKSLEFLKGSTLDYVKTEDGLGETFKIKNPNAKSSCGCGKSESF